MNKKRVKEIIIVSGLPRSGTSMMMQMLEAAGIAIVADHIRKSDEDNPKGYYELEEVKNINNTSWIDNCHGKAVKVISALLQNLPSTKNYKIIFMERDLNEILASQKAMLQRLKKNGADISDDEMILKFKQHLEQIKKWLLNKENMDVLYVNFRDVIDRTDEVARKVINFLGTDADITNMVQVVDERLYRQKFRGINIT